VAPLPVFRSLPTLSLRAVTAPLVLLALALGATDASARDVFPSATTGTVRAAAATDPAAALYDPAAVSLAEIELPLSSIDALNADPSEYQPGTLVMTVAGVQHGPLQVGVRLKGSGSFQPLSGKASFKLKLNWVSGQKLLGLKKMTLNNMGQDPSRIHELLAYTLHRAAGVPASRSGFTFVTLNGEDYGLYSNIETYDDVSLKKLFVETKHLYEGSYDAGFGADLRPGHETAFEVDEGDETDRSDLTALIAAAGRSDGTFSANVAAFADLYEMTRMWAVDNYAGNWDSYSVTAGNPLLPNNYYLHDGPDGVFRMLPSGTDLAFSSRAPIGVGDAVLISQCRAEPDCKARFDAQLAAVRDLASTIDWDTMIGQVETLIAPYVERDVRSGIAPDEVAAAIQAVREFLAVRAADVDAYLTPPPPESPVDQPPVVQSPAAPAGGARETAAPKPPCVVPELNGATLAKARRRLAGAHCSLGNVTRSKRVRTRKPRVIAFSPQAGKRRPGGAKVKLTLSGKKRTADRQR
jgi:CotH kinase protein